MKLIITQAQYQATIEEATRIPGMRIGQHFVNTLMTEVGHDQDTARLYYCPNTEFHTTALDFLTVE